MNEAKAIKRSFIKVNKKVTFVYKKNGVKCSKKDLDRIKKLHIPPNWTNVLISDSELSHLQVTGHDSQGRTQYLYHPMWTMLVSTQKYERMGKFFNKIKGFESRISKDLRSSGTRLTIAIMFRILQKTHIRVGNECYAKDNNTYGLTTLERRHVNINKNGDITLSFVGKKGVAQKVTFRDQYCLNYITKLKIGKNQKLFNVTPATLNKYLQQVTNSDFTCKDFRTYASNMLFLKILCKYPVPKNPTEAKKILKIVYDQVANKLGHSSAISKKSYVMSIFPEQYLLKPGQFSGKNPDLVFKKVFKLS
jgi:DNA topoisomerase-1